MRRMFAIVSAGLAALGLARINLIEAQTTPSNNCPAISIQCPVAGGCTQTSPFGPRTDPITHQPSTPHRGVDLRAATGTNVSASAEGTVSYVGSVNGYGNTVVIRHTVGSTAYAHLQGSSVRVGDTVTQGQVVGTADSTGTRSTGSHLHFEYLPNNQLVRGALRIDPWPCIQSVVSGNILVSDNGPVKDDAFSASVDGIPIGQTMIGQANNLGVSNLNPGRHTLVVTAITAPDDAGTLQIDLSSGWTFADGSTSYSTTLRQGASTPPLTFIVP